MKILMINSVCGIRSTGRICTDLATELEHCGHEVKIAYGRETVPEKFQKYAVRIGNGLNVYASGICSRCFGNEGFNSTSATKKFLKWAESFNPDLVWLHNLHGYYINVELLFKWIKSRPNMQVKWSLHDCWPFTGHCPHFVLVKCDRWKTECGNCVRYKQYPKSLFIDNSKNNFIKKKELFTNIPNMTLIIPTHWLENFVKESFLKEYPVEIIPHKINQEIFKPRSSDFREKHNLQDKKIILGAATAWGVNKGLNDFIDLSGLLGENYAVVLVGLTKKQIKNLPSRIVALERTNNAIELAEMYTAADVFVNPSKLETFGMTTVEAAACGTPTVVYKGTACEEIIEELNCGISVEPGVQHLYDAIISITG